MGSWKYEIVHDYDATKLIKEFREENLKLKNAKGVDDNETDCIIYAEKDDHTISLGRVLLVKMSNSMIRYYYEYKNPDYLPKYWAKYIYDENKNSKTFQFKEEEISDAFLESIKLQTKQMNVSALEVQNYIKKVTENLSDNIRKEEKFSREQWDPTLKSDQYLFAQPELAINYFVEKCNSLKNNLSKIKKQLEHIKSFKVIGKEYKVQTIEDIIKGIDEQIKSIETLKNWLVENRDDIKLNIAYFCGIFNGIVEFIAGFIDIGLLAINIVIGEILSEETNLELLEIREAVEEMLSKILKDPVKVFNDIIEAIKNYKYSRYDDPKLNQYQLQYNEGEDAVLATDIIITIILIIKAIVQLAKLLPKFTRWIESVLSRNGKGAKKLKNIVNKEYIKLSDELVNATKNKELFQSSNNLDELYDAARIANVELKKNTTSFAIETNGKAGFRDGLKSKERALEKINSDYSGEVARLVDIAGSKVVYETVDDLYRALQKFHKENKILKIKDRIQKPLNGYRDILMNIEAKNGHIVEFRLHLKEMDEVADGIGHKLYEEVRSIKAKAIIENRKLTIDEFNNIKNLEEKSLKLYDEAWIKIINK